MKPGAPVHVWIVNHYADAPDRPIGTRHFDLARQLVARGYRVTIFAASFSHLTGRDERLRKWQFSRRQVFDGVEFIWVRTFPYRGNTWRRRLNMLSFLAGFLVVQSRYRRPSVVLGSTVHPFAALGAWFAARVRGVPFLFEVRDLWPQTLIDLGEMRDGSRGERLLRSIESHLVRKARRVVTLLPGMETYLAERGLPTSHLVYLPNGVDLVAFDESARTAGGLEGTAEVAAALVDRFHADGRFVLGYTGSYGRVNRLAVMIEAARIAEEREPGRVGLVLVGDGPERIELQEQAAQSPNVAVGPPVPKTFVPRLLGMLDATVVHATATPVYRFGISFNKLFEYMAAAKPIVFACGSAYDPVRAVGAGISVEPDDAEALATAYLKLASLSEAERAAMGAAGRSYVIREHNIEHLGDVLADVLAYESAVA